METAVLRDTYARLLTEGKALFGHNAGAVQARACTLGPADVIKPRPRSRLDDDRFPAAAAS